MTGKPEVSEPSFQIKGSVVTVVVLELLGDSTLTLTQELAEKIHQAPQLLLHSPVVFNLEKFSGQAQNLDLTALLAQCRELGLQPIGFRGGERFASEISATGLAVLPASAGRGTPARSAERPAAEEQAVSSNADKAPERVRGSKLVTQPVRSGQQIYARDSDLIVMSQVSEGAEVLADGSIHIYGGLRGRALAGVRGDTDARIFCQRMEAELLSVAGNFMLSDDMPEAMNKQSVQIYLEGEKLCLDPL